MHDELHQENWIWACSMADLEGSGCCAVQSDGHTLAIFLYGGKVYAVDNRCPHMGFPLNRGTVNDGILTCHWHHARFDLGTGGTFDLWADDARVFPVSIRGGDVYVDLASDGDSRPHQRVRLLEGLQRNISLIVAKSVLSLLDSGEEPALLFRVGLEFGVCNRQAGWGSGLTTHTCMMNLIPTLHRRIARGLSTTGFPQLPPRQAAPRVASRFVRCPEVAPIWQRSSGGSASLSRCVTARGPSARSSRPSLPAPAGAKWPIFYLLLPPIIA